MKRSYVKRRTIGIYFLAVAAAAGLVQLGGIARANTTFPQTGQTVWGPFEKYWNEHGGLAQFGLPRTSVYGVAVGGAGDAYDAQWFERALFTYNPKNADPFKVQLQLLGASATENRRDEAAFKPATKLSGASFFQETSHNLSGKLLQYWQSTGGLPVYGYPISEQFTEVSKSDGKAYTVQYFQRNRLELHPEMAGTRFEVQLGLLGSEMLDKEGGPVFIATAPKAQFYPPLAGGVNVPGGGIVEPGSTGTPEPTPTTIPQAPSLPAANRPTLYGSDFSTGDLGDWQPLAALAPSDAEVPVWRARGGLLEQIGDAHTEGTAEDAFLLLNKSGLSMDNVALDVYFRGSSGEPLGVVFWYSGDGFYLLRLYGDGAGGSAKAELLQVTAGKRTLVASSTNWPGYTRNRWQRLSLVANGASIATTVDNAPVLSVANASLLKGKVGLYAFATGIAKFDNFRITQPVP